MGLLEAVVVVYLRRLLGVGVGSVLTPPSGSVWRALEPMELAREAATVVMIVSVAWLAGGGWRRRVGAFALVFGIWDLAYYAALAGLVGWPRGPLDWDLLFLIPAPWWGPVLAPILIAAVLVAAGTRLMRAGPGAHASWPAAGIAALGAVALVATFLLTTPPHFPWTAYVPSLVVFAAGLLRW